MAGLVKATRTTRIIERAGECREAEPTNVFTPELADDEVTYSVRKGDLFESGSDIVRQLPDLFD
jgi:hypothetical protein